MVTLASPRTFQITHCMAYMICLYLCHNSFMETSLISKHKYSLTMFITAFSIISSVANCIITRNIKAVISGLIITFLAVPVMFFMIVLFGAQLTEEIHETLFLASLLSVLCILNTASVLGTSSELWIRVLILHRPISTIEAMVMFTCYGSILGAWLGAFTIPLDWDRPWQVWPIPCSIGTMAGYALGLIVSLLEKSLFIIISRTYEKDYKFA